MMNPRTARLIAWSLVAVFIVLAAAGLTLQALAGTSYTNIGLPVLSASIVLVGMWPVTGALIVSRHPGHPVGWLLSLSLMAGSFDMFTYGYLSYDANVYPGSLPGVSLALIWLTVGGFPFAILAFTLILLLFPDGRFSTPRWRAVGRLASGALILYLSTLVLKPGPVDATAEILVPNPLGVSTSFWAVLEPLNRATFAIMALCYGAAIVSLVVRLRRARGEERQQIKWLVYPSTLFMISVPFLFIGTNGGDGLILGMAIAISFPGLMGMVVAVAFAIFKYRLYDIDLIIHRTLVYGALTGVLALVYFSGVAALQYVLPTESPIALVLSTLAAAALFSPLRGRIQTVIDRRFYRHKYDARQTLDSFNAQLKHEVDVEKLSEALLAVVNETFRPAHVSFWLKEEES
jgi:hypothetical protein